MDAWRFLEGTIRVALTSADIGGAMAAIGREQILIWDLERRDELTLFFRIRRGSWRRLEEIMDARGDQLLQVDRAGVYWTWISLWKRPVFLFGTLLLLAMSVWLPGRVLFVQVEGNTQVEARRILESAAQCGISFGASRREVRSEKIKNALLAQIPELSWAGVNTYGCTAVISVREREPEQSRQESSGLVSSIVASRDGVIRQITVLKGNALCVAGQAVKAGQVLISGYTDCGIAIRATAANGEIFAETSRKITAYFPTECQRRASEQRTVRNFTLIIGKKRINFANNSGIYGAGCAKIYTEKYVTLPGGFVLPFCIVTEICTFYETESASWQNDLQTAASDYLLEDMCAGRILQMQESLEERDGLQVYLCHYSCYEMIGITRLEESILHYGEDN